MEIIIAMLSLNCILLLALLVLLVFLARKNNHPYSYSDDYDSFESGEAHSYLDEDVKNIKEQIS